MNLALSSPMSPSELQERLMLFTKVDIQLVMNENHSTFLSVLRKGRRQVKLSLHKFFLYANDWVIEAIVDYSLKRNSHALVILRTFINEHFKDADYSDKVKKESLLTKGNHYDLSVIYSRVNSTYFENKLNLSFTWFKKPIYRNFSSLTFGSYSRPLKLIRMNALLDISEVPSYFLDFVMYHEMLHEVCPPTIDKLGRSRVHTKEFRMRERLFDKYQEVTLFEKNCSKIFLKQRKSSGWT